MSRRQHRITLNAPFVPGQIIAVAGADDAVSDWCEQIAHEDEISQTTALLQFRQQAAAAQRIGWPQARYYTDDGETVAQFLSYNSVHDINPFEIGAKRPETRRTFRIRLKHIISLLDIVNLLDHPIVALSNGETRRVLLARALAKNPRILVLDNPAAGLDFKQREKLKSIVAELAKRELSIVFAYRHADEVPEGACWYKLTKSGRLKHAPAPRQCAPKAKNIRNAKVRSQDGSSVVEIQNLNLSIAGKTLFKNFSWTVRRGERWILSGENGSGKTTLMALVTGDSPLAYAADIKVFGQPRDTGAELAKIRRRIAMVSPEIEASYGISPKKLISNALRRKIDLLILDEPFANLGSTEAKRQGRIVDAYLKAHPSTTAILICHRDDEAPRAFTKRKAI